MQHLAEFRAWFDPKLDAYLQERTETLPDSPLFVHMGKQLRALATGGKRLRPFVALTGYESAGGVGREYLLPLLYALELYHLFALIHDDILDHADERHGTPCMHTLFGTNQGILAGDLCLAWAYDALAAYEDRPAVMRLFSRLSMETIHGQMLDVALSEGEPVTLERIDQRTNLKTARYTFVYPALMGRALAGDVHDARYEVFCGKLGMAFQRLDDLADALWTAEALGKEPMADVRNGVPTHLSYYFERDSNTKTRALLRSLFGNVSATTDTLLTLQSIVRNAASTEAERLRIKNLIDDAESIMRDIAFAGTTREKWDECVGFLREKLDSCGRTPAPSRARKARVPARPPRAQ